MKLLLGFFSVSFLWAQDSVSLDWGSLLSSIKADNKLRASTERVDLMKTSAGPGIWNKLDLRYELDGLDMKDHKVEARVSPYAWGERTAMKAEWNYRLQSNESQRTMSLSEALHDRYKLGLLWIYHQRQLTFHQTLLKVYKDRVMVHLGLTGSERFDPQDLVISQQMVANLEGNVLGDQNDLQELENEIRAQVSGWKTVKLDTALISVTEVRKMLDAMPSNVDSTFPEYLTAQNRLHIAESKQQRVDAVTHGVVSYVGTGYEWQFTRDYIDKTRSDKTTPIQDVSIGIGFSVPIGDGRAQERLRASIDLMDEKTDLLQTQWKMSQKVSEIRMNIASLVGQIAVQDSFVANVDAGALFADYARRIDSDPLLLLRARALSIQTAWQAEKLRFDILQNYLALLELTGELARNVGTNQLLRKTGT